MIAQLEFEELEGGTLGAVDEEGEEDEGAAGGRRRGARRSSSRAVREWVSLRSNAQGSSFSQEGGSTGGAEVSESFTTGQGPSWGGTVRWDAAVGAGGGGGGSAPGSPRQAEAQRAARYLRNKMRAAARKAPMFAAEGERLRLG